MPRRMNEREFLALLDRRRPDDGVAVDALIDRRCGQDVAVLVCDSAGFSRRTHEAGILAALAAIRRAYARVKPLLARHQGRVLSEKADNLIAVFPDVLRAVRAAVELRRRTKREEVRLCMGIEWGRVILLADDIYGAPVNVAAKLGEDLAGQDEILVTAEVARRVRARVKLAYSRSTEIGGRLFELYKIR